MRRLAERSGLSAEGRGAVAKVLDLLESRLTQSWPRRLFAKRGHLFPELICFSAHVAALPQLLTLATELDAVADEPSFAPVLRVIKNVPTGSDWQHMKLQLEVARAARWAGWGVEFEPRIPGSAHRGDLLLTTGQPEQLLVETTTLFRADEDLSAEAFEDALRERIWIIEREHSVSAVVDLVQRLDAAAMKDWLEAIEGAAAHVHATGERREVESPGGTVRLQAGEIPVGTILFKGVPRYRDVIHRLGSVVAGKAAQSKGPYPVWLRIDPRDGLFMFTEWSRMPPDERVVALSQALKPYTDKHPHLHGLICSSGPSTAIGATDPAVEDARAESANGFMIRRLLGPHLARETFIMSLRPDAAQAAHAWADAYASEPTWLDHDLAALNLPPLAAFWT